MRTLTFIVVLVALALELPGAQQPKPAFEVASIKRNVSGAPGFGGPTATSASRPMGFVAVNVTLRQLIGTAYGVEVFTPAPSGRLLGGPSWVGTDRFDISARAATEISRQQANAMLRALLEDRFKLVVVTEQRQRDAYVLRLARADGRLGPDLRKAADGCDIIRRKDPLAVQLVRPAGVAQGSAGDACRTIDSVAAQIEFTLNAAVINETGLTGQWDFLISHAGPESGVKPGRDGIPREYPSIFQAVEEQLGLRLERRREKAPYDVLVIKSVELPSEN